MTMAVNNVWHFMQWTRINLWCFRDKNREGWKNYLGAHQQSFWWPLVLQKPLTKKRLRVNPWLLLYVYVLPTGYSKIGLVPAGQLHAQRERVLLRQALFGPTLVGNRPQICASWPMGKNCPQGFGKSAVMRQNSVSVTTQSGGGRFQFLWWIHSMWN